MYPFFYLFVIIKLGDDMLNNRGFAFTTIIYALVLLLGLSIFLVFGIVSSKVNNSSEFGKEVDRELENVIFPPPEEIEGSA